jgi:hypothetical protein
MNHELPPLIPTRRDTTVTFSALALATKDDLHAYAQAGETCAATAGAGLAKLQVEVAHFHSARAYWTSSDPPDRRLCEVVARHPGHVVASGGELTLVDIDKRSRELQKLILAQVEQIAFFSRQAIAARRALALWRSDDPAGATYAQVAGRTAAGPSITVAPQVDVHLPPAPPPADRVVTMQRSADGSIHGRVTAAP